ncbi:MAG: dimethyl sulfoxide reductase anchor subunit [Rhodocyclales bacterium]|nr:dimethyl sulfoxide reductase anchor subunit [Rhodocyclales bacterium]
MKSRNQKPTERFSPRQQQNWDWRAAANFIFGGAGGGLLLLAAFTHLMGGDARLPLLAGMALIGTGLTCVWFEIGRPWRALNVYRHIATSWMTREAMVALPLFACGALAALTGHTVLVFAAGLLGAVFLYSQARILNANKGIPAWRHPRCLPLLGATGLAEGAGLMALFAPFVAPGVVAVVAVALIAALVLRVVMWRSYLSALRADGAPVGSLKALDAIDMRLMAIAHAVPAGLAGVAAIGVPGASLGLLVAGLLAVAGGWVFKFTLIRRAAYSQGMAVPHLPVRGRGVAGPRVKPGWTGQG